MCPVAAEVCRENGSPYRMTPERDQNGSPYRMTPERDQRGMSYATESELLLDFRKGSAVMSSGSWRACRRRSCGGRCCHLGGTAWAW